MPIQFDPLPDSTPVTTTALSTLTYQVLPYVPGCTDDLALQELSRVFAEFCRDTQCYRKDIEITTTATDGVVDTLYPVAVDTGSYLYRLGGVCLDGSPIICAVTNASEIKLLSDPKEGQLITALAVLMPEPGATSGPAWLVQRFGPAFVAGAKARLMNMAQRPWSNPSGAAMEQKLYLRLRGESVKDVIQAKQLEPVRVQIPGI